MKKLLAIVCILSLMTAFAACGAASEADIKAVRNVSFAGTALTVTLGTNKSTGYEWDCAIYGAGIAIAGRDFKATGGKGNDIGEENVTFKGVAEGKALLVFTTKNGWDGTGAGDGYTVCVVSDANGKITSAGGIDGVAAAEAAGNTPLALAKLAEGTYTGTMSGVFCPNSSETIFSTISPANIDVTIQNGQITLYCEAANSAYGVLKGVVTPQSPETKMIASGSLPLQQSGDAVTAEGELTMAGTAVSLFYNDWVFSHWQVNERAAGNTFACTVRIILHEDVPVAYIALHKTRYFRVAAVPLALQ